MKRTALFNGEYGYDENIVAMPPNVTDTYDHDDDETEDDLIVCDPAVDYECDGDMLDNYDGWHYDEENFDVFRLKELIQKCSKEFEDLKSEYVAISNTLTDENKQLVDELIEAITNEIFHLNAYMSDPMVFSNNIDMHIMLNCLSKKETIPDLIILRGIVEKQII